MLRALAVVLCAFLSLSTAQAQYAPGFAPGFRPGFQFVGGLPTYDFANGSYGPISDTRASAALAADKTSNYTSFSANTLRVTNVGATIEGAQTNYVRNSTMQGAVAGTPGTPPTYWTFGVVSGITAQIIGTGTENGIVYIDVTFSGISSTSGNLVSFTPENGSLTASSAQSWSYSTFIKIVSGSLPGTMFLYWADNGNGGSASITQPTTAGLSTQRIASTHATGTSTTALTGTNYYITGGSGVTVNVTLRIGLPQLERMDNYVVSARGLTSPIPTSGAAGIRAADAASIMAPAGAGHILYTFNDGSTQQVAVSPGSYTISTSLNRPIIARMQVQP